MKRLINMFARNQINIELLLIEQILFNVSGKQTMMDGRRLLGFYWNRSEVEQR